MVGPMDQKELERVVMRNLERLLGPRDIARREKARGFKKLKRV